MASIKMVICDVDGTLTDGYAYYSARGEEMKAFNMRDGLGIRLLKENSIIPILITGENSGIVQARAKKLGIKAYLGAKDKLAVVKRIAKTHGVKLSEIAYIGDDVNDIQVMKAVGLCFAPQDAVFEVIRISDVVLKKKGGEGAVREAIDAILEMNRKEAKS